MIMQRQSTTATIFLAVGLISDTKKSPQDTNTGPSAGIKHSFWRYYTNRPGIIALLPASTVIGYNSLAMLFGICRVIEGGGLLVAGGWGEQIHG
jgi:hypothetical protein